MTYTIRDTLKHLENGLYSLSETYALDAQILLAHALDKSRTWILSHPEATISYHQSICISKMQDQLKLGLPLPYILGHWEFFGLDFIVTPDVLIPRPETETLVDHAIKHLTSIHRAHKINNVEASSTGFWIADVGTGSGCIAITLAIHFPELQVIAIDISMRALQVAQRNAQFHNVANRILFLQADLLSPLSKGSSIHDMNYNSFMENPIPTLPVYKPSTPGTFQLICANLPYIPTQTLQNLDIFGKEPDLALDGGSDGLELIRRLLVMAPGYLVENGLLLVEIEATQGSVAFNLAQGAFPQSHVSVLPDLAGKDRLLMVQC